MICQIIFSSYRQKETFTCQFIFPHYLGICFASGKDTAVSLLLGESHLYFKPFYYPLYYLYNDTIM